MTPGQLPPEDVRFIAARLVNLIQVLAVNESGTLRMVERSVLALVAEHRRQRLGEQLGHLNAEALAEVGCFLERLRQGSESGADAP